MLLCWLRATCNECKSDPELCDLLIKGIERWFDREEPLIEVQYHQEVLDDQNIIGWRQVFSGRLSRSWAVAQDKYATMECLRASCSSGQEWTTKVISVIWNWVYEIWEL